MINLFGSSHNLTVDMQ